MPSNMALIPQRGVAIDNHNITLFGGLFSIASLWQNGINGRLSLAPKVHHGHHHWK